MARLSKATLLAEILDAVRGAGWTATPLSAQGEHPLRFVMERDGRAITVRAYAWNLTHGGGANRPRHEYRIQITSGISAFEIEPMGITLILGWNPSFGAFAAFDLAYHSGPLGASASIQISSASLEAAAKAGIATHRKGSGEVAVAVRPDFLAHYIADYAGAHRGDLERFFNTSAEESAIADRAEPDFMAMANPARDHRFGHADERAERQTILNRLTALERELEEIRPRLGMIGHNNPPEPIAPNQLALADELSEASTAIKAEMAKAEPDVMEIAKRAVTMQRAAGVLHRLRDEAAKSIAAVKEKARERIADAVVTAIGGGSLLFAPQIFRALEGAVDAMARWFHTIL